MLLIVVVGHFVFTVDIDCRRLVIRIVVTYFVVVGWVPLRRILTVHMLLVELLLTIAGCRLLIALLYYFAFTVGVDCIYCFPFFCFFVDRCLIFNACFVFVIYIC